LPKRRYLVLAPDSFDDAKTAHGVIRYGNDDVVAVVDGSLAGRRVRDVFPHLRNDAPIVASVAEGLAYEPSALLIGTAPMGGGLPQSWRDDILAAIAAKLEIVSGLHDMLGDDAAFAAAARAAGTAIWDVRKPPDVPLFSGAAYAVAPPVVLMVGNDCAVGKMTAALELAAAARARGLKATFVPTGQTGIMIAGWGISVDRVVSDFATGACEQLVLQAAAGAPDLIVVEGQGAINHPAYAPVTLALMLGCAPDALVLVCEVPHDRMNGFEIPSLDYPALIALHEEVCKPVKPARVVGIALNTRGIADEAFARTEIERAARETQLPVDDLVRFGPDAFYAAIAPRIIKRALRQEKIA
jgi:uncharacterized NAD-dependent epimerase/dehydratase family protein